MTQILDAGWKLKSLRIDFQNYGDYTGKYVGKVEFNNRENEAFMFNLSPEETSQYIDLVSAKLVNNASHLGDKLLTSLNLLTASKVVEIPGQQIPDPIEKLPPLTGTEFEDLPF